MAKILKGAEVAQAMAEGLAARVAALNAKGAQPLLAIVRLGEKPDDLAYEIGAAKRCEKLGLAVRRVTLPGDAPQAALIKTIEALNADGAVHGVLLLRPLPPHLDDAAARNALAPEKDVDGITDASLAAVFTGGGRGFAPCTARACMEILNHYGIDPAGKRAVVLGRSLTVGKPVAMMLLARHATVTLCHSRTADLAAVCREGDILIASVGRAGLVGAECLAPGQTVIDVGINVDADGKLRGDVDFAAAEAVAAAVTPVPGGVGTVTTSVLAAQVLEAAERQFKR